MASRSQDLVEDVRPVDALAFLCELVVLGLLSVCGWRLGGGVLASLGLAVALPLVTALVWGRWMAPRSAHRLPQPARLVAECAVFVAAAALAAAVGLLWLGVAVAVVSGATFAVIARRETRSP